MNLLERLILSKATRAQLEQKAESFFTGTISRDGRLIMPVDNKQTYIDEGYNKNDIIYSIINIILDKCRLPYWNLNKVIDETKLRQYRDLMSLKDISHKQYKTAMMLRKEALTPISNFNLQQGKLNDLLKFPNERETFQEFIAYGTLYKLVTGDCYMWADLLSGGANAGVPNSLNILPSQHMRLTIRDTFPASVAEYVMFVWNIKFAPETILHEIYSNPNWNINGEQLYGFSPLRAFLKNIVRNNAAKDASIAKFQNGGVEQLLFINSDSKDIDGKARAKQADLIKERLMSPEFRGPQAQGMKAVSGLPIGAVSLGNSPVELGITESEKWDAIMLCNGYGLPPELLGLTNKTFNNIKEAEKALTTRSALPVLESRKNALNRKIQTDWGFKGQNLYLDYSTECFPELQADQNITAEWLKTVIMLSPDEQREVLGLDVLNTTESKEQWVLTSSGYVPLSDFQTGQVDVALLQEQMLAATAPSSNNNNNANNNGQQNGQANTASSNGVKPKPVAAN